MSDYKNKTEIEKTKKQNTAHHKTGKKVIKLSKCKKNKQGRNIWYMKKRKKNHGIHS